jgi:hypothetical protein
MDKPSRKAAEAETSFLVDLAVCFCAGFLIGLLFNLEDGG